MTSPVRILEIVSFMDLLASGLIVPQLPSHARSLGCNHIGIGLMGALYSAFQLMSSPLTGSLSDLKGRPATMLLTLCLSGVAYTLLGVTSSVVVFLALRAILGITKHTQLLAKAIAPDYVKDNNELSEVYGRLSTLKQAGMAVGPIIGGHIMESFPEHGFTIIGFLVGVIFAVNSGLIRRLPSTESGEKKEQKEKATDAIAPTLLNSAKANYNQSLEQFHKIDWKIYGEIFSFKLLITMCLGLYITNYVLFLKIKHGVTPVTIGYTIAVFSATSSLTSFFIGYVNAYYKADQDYTERNFHVFSALTMSLVGVMIAPTVFIYVLFIIPLGISTTVGSLVTQEVILSKTDKELRGTVLGVANNLRSLTGVVAPLITGVISQFVGVLYVINISILLAAVGTYKSYVVRQQSLEAKKK